MKVSSREYGQAAWLGLGVPQANSTVEPEFRRLMPGDVECFTVRLRSASPDPHQRAIDYLELLPELVRDFATLRVDRLLFACTGSSYLISDAAADAIRAATEDVLGAPVLFAADAVRAQLLEHGVERVALLSPYPDWLNGPAIDYWRRQGFDVVDVAQVDIGSDNTDGIYGLTQADIALYVERLLGTVADGFLVSGTGMPSLGALDMLRASGKPAVSSNSALAQQALALIA